MDYADVLVALVLGLCCGGLVAFSVVAVPRLFWPLVAFAAVIFAIIADLPPLEDGLVAAPSFVACFLLGYWLVCRLDGGWGHGGADEDGDPPWWPEFEEQLAGYVRSLSRPRTGVR